MARALDACPIPMALLNTYTAVPLLAMVAGALVPNSTRVARGLAAALGCLLGITVGAYLDRAKKDGARYAVLRLLAKHMGASTAVDELRSLIRGARRRFSVTAAGPKGDAFEDNALCEIYAQFLNAVLEGPEHDSYDLPAMQRLKAALELDGIVVGAAHKRAAQLLISRGYSGLTGEAMTQAVDKFLFLSERAFADEPSTEAGLYEMGRLKGMLNVSDKDARQRISAVSQALYRQSLSTVAGKVDSQTGEALAGASAAFGLAGEQAAQMNAESYRQIATDLLKGGRLSAEGRATLTKAQAVLQLGDPAAASAFAAVAAPYLRQEVEKASEQLAKATDAVALVKTASALAERRMELGLPAHAGTDIIAEGFVAQLRELYNKACKDARINGEPQALATLDMLLTFSANVDTVMGELRKASGDTEGATQLTLAADSLPARRLYGLYLSRSIKGADGKLDPKDLARVFELSESDEELARIEACQPRLRELFADSIAKAEGGGPPLSLLKLAVQAEMAKFALPRETVHEAAMEVYRARLEPVSARVLKAGQKEDLDAALNFLGLAAKDVRMLHLKAFGKVYEESVREAMGRSGIMNPDGREALVQLRERLGISEEDSQKFFYGVVDERLKDMMEDVRESYEEATYTKDALKEVWKKRGKDVGDDPMADGTGGSMGILETPQLEGSVRGFKLMTSLCTVADFYLKNKVLKEDKSVKPDDAYPVTVGKYIDEKTKEEMYGIFAWNAVTSQDAAYRDQWKAAQPHVGGIMGMSEDTMQKVMVRMVSRWANGFIKQKIQEKGKLGEEEISTLTNWVPTFFGIGADVTKDMVQSANKGVLQSKVLRLLNQPKVLPTDVQNLREEVDQWKLDIQKDLELTRPQLRSLFRVEVTATLEDSQLSHSDKQDAVANSKASFGLAAEEAASELRELVQARARGYLVNAVGDLMQGNEEQAMHEMRRLELLAEFAEGSDEMKLKQEWDVAPALRANLLKVYVASPIGEGKAANVELLESILGVSAK